MIAKDKSRRIIVKRQSNAHLIHISGDCDAVMSRRLRRVLTTLIDNGECRFVVDLAEVRYLTSSALWEFWRVQKRIDANGSLTLRKSSEQAGELLDLSGLLRLPNVRLD